MRQQDLPRERTTQPQHSRSQFFVVLACAAFAIFSLQAEANEMQAGWAEVVLKHMPPVLVAGEQTWEGPPASSGGLGGFAASSYSGLGPAAVTPEITALAASLGNDPEEIFAYVRDHVEFQSYYGSMKGAQGALLERAGNAWDQSSLLIALLEAAGHTGGQYVFGTVEVPDESVDGHDLMSWLGVRKGLVIPAINNTANVHILWDYGTYLAPVFDHVWVRITIGGQTYDLDPSYAPRELFEGVDIDAVGGFSRTELLTAAAGVVGTSDVQQLDREAVETTLGEYAIALSDHITTNLAEATVEEITGGSRVVPGAVVALSNAGPRASFKPAVVSVSSLMPLAQAGTYRVRVGSTVDHTFRTDELAGGRVSLTFGTGDNAQLWHEDDLVAQETGATGTSASVILSIAHPGAGSFYSQTLSASSYSRNADFDITVAVFPYGKSAGRVNASLAKLAAYASTSVPANSREMITEALHGMGVRWARQVALGREVIGNIAEVYSATAHILGRSGQEDAFSVDMPGLRSLTIDENGTNTPAFRAGTAFASAFEHAVVEQSGARRAVSTIRCLVFANDAGQRIFRATGANWASVSSQLDNYSGGQLSSFGSFAGSGFTLLLQENGLTAIDNWSGHGAALAGAGATGMIITGNLNGGFGTDDLLLDGYYILSLEGLIFVPDSKYHGTPPAMSGEPVDLRTGAYTFEKVDLSLGAAGTPRGLEFMRSYDSSRAGSGDLGRGWTHSNHGRAHVIGLPEMAFGFEDPTDAAQIILAARAALEFSDFAGTAKELMMWVFAAHWAAESCVETTANIEMATTRMTYKKQPDGSWEKPPGTRAQLEGDRGSLTLKPHLQGEIAFDNSDRISTWTDPSGNTRTYVYDSAGRLATVEDSVGRTLTFAYPNATDRNIVSVTDSTGRTVTFGCTGGNLTSAQDPASHTTTFDYDTANRLTDWIDPLSETVAINEYDLQGRVIRQLSRGDEEQEWIFDYRESETDEIDPDGRITTHVFDNNNRYTAVRNPLAQESLQIYDAANRVVESHDASGRVTLFRYDNDGNLIEREDPAGEITVFGYDSTGRMVSSTDATSRITTFTYDAAHRLTSTTDPGNRATTFTYRSDGLVQTITSPGNRTTTFSYDSLGHLTGVTRPDSTTTAATHNARGDILTSTDARGETTTFTFDARRLPLTRTDALGLTTTWAFDENGYPASTTNRRGQTTLTPSDNFGLLQSVTAPDTGAINYTYDVRDLLTTATDGLGHTTTTERDAAGRPIAIENALGATVTTLGYDPAGRITTRANGLAQTTSMDFDEAGRPETTTDPLSREITVAHDNAGRRISLTNARGQTFSFGYGTDGLPTTFTYPSGRVSQISERDERGLPTEMISPSGRVTELAYDDLGRVTSTTDPAGTITTARDPEGNPTTITEGSAVITRTFDALGRVQTCTDTQGQTVSYTYDAEGNVTVVTYPDAKTVTYTYDGANRMKTVTDWAARVTTYNYDDAGRLTSLTRPNGTTATYTYDNANRLTGTTETRGLDTFWQATYTFDAAYRLTGYSPTPMNKTWPPPPASMTYDVDNRLTTYNGASVASDLDGNLLQAPLHGTLLGTLTWDARNRLTSAESTIPNPQSPIGYTYDAENRRTSSTSPAGTTTYTWSRGSLDRLLVKTNPDGSITRYIHGLGLLYEETEPAGGGSSIPRFYHYNWQGSTAAITDATGTVTTRIGYNPYGHHTVEFGAPNTPFLFNGQWGVMTEPNGLLSMMARFHSPTFRRFLSEDPAGFAGGINLYAFAGGDPINFMDPFGLGPISVWERLGGGAQFVGGVSQSLLGVGFAVSSSPTVAGSVIGVLVTLHGMDQAVAGWNTMLGYPTDTVTTTLLMETGIPYHTAVTIDASLGMGGSMKVAAMTMQTVARTVAASPLQTPPLAHVLEGHSTGQAFSGVFDPKAGQVLIRPSTSSVPLPEGFVARAGGHAQVARELGADSSQMGFTAFLEDGGSLRVEWLSRSVNGPNPTFPGYIVPEAQRSTILQSIEAATGRNAY